MIIRKPSVSIITSFNSINDLFWETYNTVNLQSFTNWEWIVVNNCTDDAKSKLIIEVIRNAKNQKIRVVDLPNKHKQASIKKIAVQIALSDHLFFIGINGLMNILVLEKLYIFLSNNPGFMVVNVFPKQVEHKQKYNNGIFQREDFFLGQDSNVDCFMVRKEVFKNISFDENIEDDYENLDFLLHTISKGFLAYTIPEELFHTRLSVENKNSDSSAKNQTEIIKRKLSVKYNVDLRSGYILNPKNKKYFSYNIVTLIETEDPHTYTSYKHLLCFFPWLEVGGADQFNLQLLEGLKKNGWTITIITTEKNNHPLQNEFELITEDIFHLANLDVQYKYCSYVNHIIKTREPSNIFISNSMYAYYILPWLKRKFPDLPIADYIHCEEPGWYNGGYPFFSTIYRGWLDKTYVTSSHLLNWCIDKGKNSDKLELCYINVDTKKINKNFSNRDEIRKKLGLTENTTLIIYVARITEQKQPLVMIGVLAELKKRGLNFYCVVIGDGPDKNKMIKKVKKHRIDSKIYFSGSLNNNDVLKYLDAADIFFLPSYYEGIALSIFEAMAKELPIVATNTGGQSELVTTDCGYLIELKNENTDIKAFSDAVSKLANDIQLRRQMGLNGRRRVEKYFQLDEMIKKMDQSIQLLKLTESSKMEFESSYLFVLNSMLSLKNENERLLELTNSKGFRFFIRYVKKGIHFFKYNYRH